MASERMMQAIGTLERAVSRLEQEVADIVAAAHSPSTPGIDVPAAHAALRSLDELIEDIRGRTHG
jgi:phage host-nuclease inhibitor protein Gam